MMTAKARGKSRIVVFHEDESERPDAPTARREDVRSIAHLKMLHGVSSKLSRLLEIDEIGATIADELRQLIDYHNCRVFLRDGDDLLRSRSAATSRRAGVGARRARDEGRRRGHGPRRGDRRAVPHRRRRQLRHRPPHRGNRPDRGVAARGAAALRRERRRRARALEARARPVRRRRPAPARGARRPCLGRARERRLYEAQRREAEARRRCSSSRASSRPSRSSTRSPSESPAAPPGSSVSAASVWLPARRRRRARVPRRLAAPTKPAGMSRATACRASGRSSRRSTLRAVRHRSAANTRTCVGPRLRPRRSPTRTPWPRSRSTAGSASLSLALDDDDA